MGTKIMCMGGLVPILKKIEAFKVYFLFVCMRKRVLNRGLNLF